MAEEPEFTTKCLHSCIIIARVVKYSIARVRINYINVNLSLKLMGLRDDYMHNVDGFTFLNKVNFVDFVDLRQDGSCDLACV